LISNTTGYNPHELTVAAGHQLKRIIDCVKPDKSVCVADLRAEFEFLLTNDATAPDWTGHELAMILGRFDRAVLNVVHRRAHRRSRTVVS
jgi:hypothetical protein